MNAETSDEIAIHWFRRDLRLADNPALAAAAAKGTVVPVVVLDPETEALGSASRWRLGLALEHLAESLEKAGSRLVLRRGRAEEALPALVRETGATSLHWQRLPEPPWQARDRRVASALGRTAVCVARDGSGTMVAASCESSRSRLHSAASACFRSSMSKVVP